MLHRLKGKRFVLKIMFPYSKDKFNFLNRLSFEQFQVHRKIEQKVQRFLIYPLSPDMQSLPPLTTFHTRVVHFLQ